MDQPETQIKYDNKLKPKSKRRRLTYHFVAGVAGGVVIGLYCTKYRKVLTCINITPEMVERAKDGGDLLVFGDPRKMTVISLTKV
jgi:hypothetical protein